VNLAFRVPDRPAGSPIRRIAALMTALLAAVVLLVVSTDRSASAVTTTASRVGVTADRPGTGPGPAGDAGPAEPIRIMPLGDSITVGVGSATRSGYRPDLAGRLAAAGVRADFVGTQQSGTGPDVDNEGHVGWSIEQIAARVDDWLALYRPDVILLHIGTNDTRSPDTVLDAPGKLSDLIDQITADRPAAEIFVAKIISTTNAKRNVLTDAYNAAVPAVVAGKGARVHLVDQSTIGGRDLYNTLHPNDFGYAKMAANWYRALEPVLGSGAAPWPAGENPYAANLAYLCNPAECRWWERRVLIHTGNGAPVRTRVWQTQRTVTRAYRVHVRGHHRITVVDGVPVRTWVAPHTAVRHRLVSVWTGA
jgi:lysophospholipase L1-like esterase